MNATIKQTLFGLIAVLATSVLLATSSLAETPMPNGQMHNNQGNGPNTMPGGMMGQGYMGQQGMGPGNMPYGGGMGRGYMRQGGQGYGGMGSGMGMMGTGMGMMQALNLDKAQRSKIRALMREQRATNCKLMTEMMDVRDELGMEYDKDQPNAKAISKTYEKMQAMQRQMLERMVVTHNKIREVLNKEQKQNFDQMFQGGMGMMNMMQGMMGYGGRGMMNMMGNGMMGFGGWNTEE